MQKKAVIYTRVSDPSQVDNNSLEMQAKSCRKFAESKGYEVVRIYQEEGRSAKDVSSRPEFRKMLSFSTKKQNRISAVVIYKFDRFSRNLEDGLATMSLLAKSNVEVLSVSEDVEQGPMGNAMRNIMLTLGQLDNELKGVRVKENMQAVFQKGLWPFKPPTGYQRKYKTKEQNKGIPPIPNKYLALIIAEMFRKASEGIYNKTQLAKYMNLRGFGDHYISNADHKIVDKILTKTFYYGYMYAPKWDEHAWGKHEPMIDKQTWDKAYQKVILKKKNYTYHDSNLYPLKGSLHCELCNTLMTTSPSRGNSGVVYYYECKNSDCQNLRINTTKAQKQFEQLLKGIKPSKRVIKLFTHSVFKHWDKVINQSKEFSEQLEEKILKLKSELKSIRKAKDSGIYTAEEAREEASTIRKEITILEVEHSDIKIQEYSAEIVREFIEHFLMNLDLLWEKLDLAKKQALLSKIFPKGIVLSKDKKIRTIELSPSFQLIKALEEEKGDYVSPPGIEPGAVA